MINKGTDMAEKKIKILQLEDTPSDADMIRLALQKGGIDFEILLTDHREGFVRALDEYAFDIILSDHSLPSFDSIQALTILNERGNKKPFILITSTISEEFAVEVMKLGAWDYVLKDRLSRLPSAVTNALSKYSVNSAHEQMMLQIIADQEMYKDAERVAHFGTWQSDLQTGITVMSDAAFRILGYEPGEMDPSAVSFLDSIHPEDLDRVQQVIAANITGSDTTGMDFRMTTKNGQIRHIHSEFRIDRDANGVATKIVGFNQDVTRQKLTRDKLIKTLSDLEAANTTQTTILDALPANIALLNDKGVVMAVNKGWRSFGDHNDLLSPDYGVGVNYIEVCRASGTDARKYGIRIAEGIEAVMNGSLPSFSMEYPCHAPDKYRWYKAEVAPLDASAGGGAVVMHIDITDRKVAELQAQELNEQLYNNYIELSDYKAALDQSSIVAITDQRGIITYANENFVKVSKYTESELIGKDHRLVNSGHHPRSFFADMWNTISSGGIWKGEIKNRAKDGSIYWVDTTILPFMDEHGKPYQYMSIRSDITERKIAEEKLNLLTHTLEQKVAERTAQLEQSMKELESFSYSVSHDLRAPLRIINGYSRLFMDEFRDKLPADAIEYINTINENAMQMGQLIEDLLNLSRLGLEAIDKTHVDMKMLAEVTLHEYKTNNSYTPPGITIGDLHPARCSRNLLKQVWVNLLGNAIKYSSKKEEPMIQVGSYIEEKEIVFFVKDNGAGFDMKYADRLFGVFQRLHHRQDFEGTGVGLALVHRIITRHGGRVWAEGRVDEGATFYFSLPAD